MIQIIDERLSKKYRVIDADDVDFEKLYSLYASNKSYFDYFSLTLSRELLIKDMTVIPDGCSKAQKHFLAYSDNDRLVAILDIVGGYPDSQTCYIGLFMVSAELHRMGIGTEIITELCASLAEMGYKALRLAYGKRYTAAKSFWIKNGFVPVRETFHEEYGSVIVAERMLTSESVN